MCEMRGGKVRCIRRFEQLLELSCGLESDVERRNKLFFVHHRKIFSINAVRGMCGR